MAESRIPNPSLSATKRQMCEWLDRIAAEKAALPDDQQMRDNSGIMIAAFRQLLSEFDDHETVMDMISRLPWVD